MALYWTNDRRADDGCEPQADGEWKDGVYIPPPKAGSRQQDVTLIHEFMRTLLNLRAA